MVQVCSRCNRVNPREAVYCYFDGVYLRQGNGPGVAPGQLPQEFTFPSGRRCRTYEDLVQGCQYEWEDARDLLKRGDFQQYLARIGRMDLARAAQEAQAQGDADIALHNFVSTLPAGQSQGPRLDLQPRRFLLGQVAPGDQKSLRLTVTNQGKGLLQGKVTVTEGGPWLKVTGCGNDHLCPLKTAREQAVNLRLDTRGLVAAQTYSGKLTVITNGGIAEVPVRLDLTTVPFPRPPFQGANSPRAMAERMRTHPKQAVPLLENGEIARWFKANGWTYPVAGATAKGVAAVQQFFECMGLSKPPPLQLSESDLHYLCVPPEVVRSQVLLRTTAKKWVYAQADSDVPWLRVTTPSVSGPQQAAIAFEIDSTVMELERELAGTLTVAANAGQTLKVRVRAEVRRPHEPFTRRLLRPFFIGALVALLFRFLLAGPADLYARMIASAIRDPGPGTLQRWLQPAVAEEGFLKLFVLATWWLGGVLGVLLVWRRGGRGTDLFCGAVAGCAAGIVGSATVGCLLTVLDGLPRALLDRLAAGAQTQSAWVWTPVWLGLACAWWAVLGGGLGFLLCGIGRGGARILTAVASPLAGLFRACGLERVADFFVLQG